MSEEKFDASSPVWVEIVPTVIEFAVTPGALPPEDAAPAAVVRVQHCGTCHGDPRQRCRRHQRPDSIAHSHDRPRSPVVMHP